MQNQLNQTNLEPPLLTGINARLKRELEDLPNSFNFYSDETFNPHANGFRLTKRSHPEAPVYFTLTCHTSRDYKEIGFTYTLDPDAGVGPRISALELIRSIFVTLNLISCATIGLPGGGIALQGVGGEIIEHKTKPKQTINFHISPEGLWTCAEPTSMQALGFEHETPAYL